MKFKNLMCVGLSLLIHSNSNCSFNELGKNSLQAIKLSTKIISCLYVTTYVSVLGHELGHAIMHKLSFPNEKFPEIIIGAQDSSKSTGIQLFNKKVTLGKTSY